MMSLSRDVCICDQIKSTRKRFAPSLSLTGVFITLYLILSTNSIAEDVLYTVKAGDTLWGISKTWLNNAQDWKKLQLINNIKNPDLLTPNSQIRIPASLTKKRSKQAFLKYFHGKITIKDNSDKKRIISSGMAIYEGDTIFTGAESSLQIEFLTGSKSTLQENSQLVIKKVGDKEGRIQLYLHQGNIGNRVKRKKGPKSRFIITTPSATASVRGTTFRLANNLQTQMFHTEVLEGTVSVSSHGKTVTVEQGFGVIVKKGDPPNSPTKLLSAVDLSGLQDNFNQTPVFFRFKAINNAVAYRIEISKGDKPNQQIFGQDVIKPEIRFVKMENGSYILRVFAYDKNGLGGKTAIHKFKIDAIETPISLKKPKIIYPNNQAMIQDEYFAFKWISSNSANGYHFQLAKDQTFSQLKIDIFPYHYTTLSIPDRLPSGNYYWHVAALDKNNRAQSYTDISSFRIQPPIPVLREAQYVDNRIELNWQIKPHFMTSNAKYRYQLQISTNANFSTFLLDKIVGKKSYKYRTNKSAHYYIRVSSLETDNFIGTASRPQHLQLLNQGALSQQLININPEIEFSK